MGWSSLTQLLVSRYWSGLGLIKLPNLKIESNQTWFNLFFVTDQKKKKPIFCTSLIVIKIDYDPKQILYEMLGIQIMKSLFWKKII